MELSVEIIGHKGIVYFKRPSLFLVFVLTMTMMFVIEGYVLIESESLASAIGYLLGVPFFLTVVLSSLFDYIQRKDIFLITDDRSYLVFYTQPFEGPIDSKVLTNIENNVFRSWNPAGRKNYCVLKFSKFNELASPKLFWLNSKRVHMERWKGDRDLPHKFNSTDRQMETLKRINTLVINQKRD